MSGENGENGNKSQEMGKIIPFPGNGKKYSWEESRPLGLKELKERFAAALQYLSRESGLYVGAELLDPPSFAEIKTFVSLVRATVQVIKDFKPDELQKAQSVKAGIRLERAEDQKLIVSVGRWEGDGWNYGHAKSITLSDDSQAVGDLATLIQGVIATWYSAPRLNPDK